MALRFIHCADLHLGTPFKGVAERFGADADSMAEILNAPVKAFQKIIDTAIQQKVDFVLFAGDITDSVNVNWRSFSVLKQGIDKLKQNNISSFVIAGNHDALPNDELKKACRNAVFFDSDEISYHEISGKAVIGGISFCAENAKINVAEKFRKQDSSLFQIALFHGNIGGQQGHDNYSPASISDLVKCDMDYWALGHIHEKKLLKENSPVILYSGSTLSHHVNEISSKGFYLVDVDDFKNVKMQFIECGTVAFRRIEADISDIDDMHDIPQKIKNIISSELSSENIEQYFIELILCGKTGLDKKLRMQQQTDLRYIISNVLPSKYNIGNIAIKTAVKYDMENLLEENIFAADLHQSFIEEKNGSNSTFEEELSVLKRACGNLLDIDTDDAESLVNDAENELLNLLTEDLQ